MNHEIRPEATADVAFPFILYAQGILPFLIYWQFSGSHFDVGRPNSKLRDLRPSF